MTRITAPWLSAPSTRAVMTALAARGAQALFVGGCVRNTLIGAGVTDIDIATDAHPERVTQLAEAAGLKTVPTGIDHGTVTVITGGVPHEVTTFRRDIETDGRRAVVQYATNVAEDARRRDFTMNALYAEADGTVLDPLGQGLADLAARRVRFIEDASARIAEDYLRILRFFRFHAWYGEAEVDADALHAVAQGQEGLSQIPNERIGAEVTKLLTAPDPAPSVASMAAVGVLARVLPGADPRALAPLVALEETANVAPSALRRLAAIGGDTVRLRLSRRDARRLAALADWAGSPEGIAEIGYRDGADMAVDAALLRAAIAGQPLAAGVLEAAAQGAKSQFPISAADLDPTLDGPEIGAALKALERRWIASDFTLTREALLTGDEH
ncbi:MAG: CCA tRNA nucleotidyltransferase [Pseudomonadota bacterium]